MNNVTRQKKLAQLPTLAQRNALYIRRVLQLCLGDVTAAAVVLDIGRATLYRKVRALAIKSPRRLREQTEARYASR